MNFNFEFPYSGNMKIINSKLALSIYNVALILKELVFPPVCSFCGRQLNKKYVIDATCKSCLAKIPLRDSNSRKIKCLEERKENSLVYRKMFNIDVIVCCYYDDMIRKAIIAMKFYDAAYMKESFGSIIAFVIINSGEVYDAIIPVPLHENRMKERGYNQAELIARKASSATGIPVIKNCLIRSRNTKRQSEMAHCVERSQNMQNAFICVCPEKLEGKRLLILDDILTSGETLISAAKAINSSIEKYKIEIEGEHISNSTNITAITLACGRK